MISVGTGNEAASRKPTVSRVKLPDRERSFGRCWPLQMWLSPTIERRRARTRHVGPGRPWCAGPIDAAFVSLLAIGPADAFISGLVAGAAARSRPHKVHGLMKRAISTGRHAEVMTTTEELGKVIAEPYGRQVDLLIEYQLRPGQTGHLAPHGLMTLIDRRMVDDVIWDLEGFHENRAIATERRALELLVNGVILGLMCLLPDIYSIAACA